MIQGKISEKNAEKEGIWKELSDISSSQLEIAEEKRKSDEIKDKEAQRIKEEKEKQKKEKEKICTNFQTVVSSLYNCKTIFESLAKTLTKFSKSNQAINLKRKQVKSTIITWKTLKD
jgi:hypothetical protein